MTWPAPAALQHGTIRAAGSQDRPGRLLLPATPAPDRRQRNPGSLEWNGSTEAHHALVAAGAVERELRASAQRCTCPDSPWCTGPTGAYWLTCNARCRCCNPPARRKPAVKA